MARKAKSPQSETPVKPTKEQRYYLPSDAKWGGFCNVRLTDDDKADYEVWLEEQGAEVWRLQEDLLSQGMKISFSYDAENEAMICTYMGKLVSNSNERYCVTTRSYDFNQVVALAVWKFVVHLGGSIDNVGAGDGYKRWG